MDGAKWVVPLASAEKKCETSAEIVGSRRKEIRDEATDWQPQRSRSLEDDSETTTFLYSLQHNV